MKAVNVIVSGLVQGVFFRNTARRQARTLGVHGWIRNTVDGGVEAFVQGEVQAVDDFVAWLGHGPDRAVVSDVAVVEADPEPDLGDFTVRG